MVIDGQVGPSQTTSSCSARTRGFARDEEAQLKECRSCGEKSYGINLIDLTTLRLNKLESMYINHRFSLVDMVSGTSRGHHCNHLTCSI